MARRPEFAGRGDQARPKLGERHMWHQRQRLITDFDDLRRAINAAPVEERCREFARIDGAVNRF
jgi:hypothetical protein